MKINILEKLTLQGKSTWAIVLTITPIILVGIIMGVWGILAANPVIANQGLVWAAAAISTLPVNYFLLFYKWFKV
jgi:hypothetical protein